MCAGLCPTYWTLATLRKIEMVAVLCTNETTPQFFEFLNPPPPRGRWEPQGEGHVGRHCPYTNNIWCGSVQVLPRYRWKTAKMQKFPIDSHSNENFICPFFRPPGAANPQKGRRHVPTQATPACKLWRESARGLSRNGRPNKKQTSASVELTQTRYSHSKQLFQGGQISVFL